MKSELYILTDKKSLKERSIKGHRLLLSQFSQTLNIYYLSSGFLVFIFFYWFEKKKSNVYSSVRADSSSFIKTNMSLMSLNVQ